MKLDSKTYAAIGRIGGQRTKDPAKTRTKSVSLRLTESELDMIDAKAEAHNLSRTRFVIQAATEFNAE